MARILLAEDEFLIRLILAEVLADSGHDVIETGTADEAAVLAEAGEPFDLLLTDIQMPGELDGLALARLVRGLQPDIPVIYVTGRPEALAKIGSLGPRDVFVRKPYSAHDVIAVVERLLGEA